jgi:prepilin-type N-terminal cleavage/methylation domain-containing protein
MNNRSLQGFTLSELLVSLAVLGLIAAFAIPKVLTATGEASARAIGREMYGMIAESFAAVREANNGNVPRATTSANLVARMNVSRIITQTAVNGVDSLAVMQNGGRLGYSATDAFSDGTIGVVGFTIDPDGAGALNDPVTIYLGGDGRIFPADDSYSTGGTASANAFVATYVGTNATAVTATAPGTGTTWFS